MAIIIPSKNIYEMNNPKIRDNIIDNVSVEYKSSTFVKEENKTVSNEVLKEWEKEEIPTNETAVNKSDTVLSGVLVGGAYIEITPLYAIIPEILVPKLQNNLFVEKLLLTEEVIQLGVPKKVGKTTYNVFGKKASGKCERDIITQKDVNIFTVEFYDEKAIIISREESKYEQFNIDNIKAYLTSSVRDNSVDPSFYAFLEKSLPDETTDLSKISATDVIIDGIEYYKISALKLLVGVKTYFGAKTFKRIGEYTTERYTIQGDYIEYLPEEISINIYGNTFGIELKDGSITYGNGKYPQSLSGNELLQQTAIVSGKPLTQHLADNVLHQYANGKETAVLLCDINNYYHENGEKAIDIKTDKMTFRLHDEVIPMVYTAEGVDRPMSKYQNGTAKVFQVVGSKVFYDGAVWQELTLQEK